MHVAWLLTDQEQPGGFVRFSMPKKLDSSLAHNQSRRIPILETSATASCGTTGIIINATEASEEFAMKGTTLGICLE